MEDLFRGELVRLTMEEPDVLAKTESVWQRDSEYMRMAGTGPILLFSEKRIREEFEKRLEKDPTPERYRFRVRTLAEDKPIGYFGLFVDLIHRDALLGIAIGEREFWSKGYGTDMMNLCLRYAFLELGLQRLTLALHEYNRRALRSYEKVGFRLEGRTRQDVLREGKRCDSLWMGILREEWLAWNGEIDE